jgi:hypothetical protein
MVLVNPFIIAVRILIVRLFLLELIVLVVVDVVVEIKLVNLFHLESLSVRDPEVILILDCIQVVHET